MTRPLLFALPGRSGGLGGATFMKVSVRGF